ncbi:Apyrase [Pseudolycoriella hygida]|uniref:Apyrase n=1 Tax=Pseudolycoriella hygida TaxID=35572 RepID=A0A9Q0MPN3_9DIPT|nr:Apyrase [Pseudolycoriella hygida]
MKNKFPHFVIHLIIFQIWQTNGENLLDIRQNELFPVSIIHMNDFHARFVETNEASTPCKLDNGEKCIGGYARAVTVIKDLLEARNQTHPIYLNAG